MTEHLSSAVGAALESFTSSDLFFPDLLAGARTLYILGQRVQLSTACPPLLMLSYSVDLSCYSRIPFVMITALVKCNIEHQTLHFSSGLLPVGKHRRFHMGMICSGKRLIPVTFLCSTTHQLLSDSTTFIHRYGNSKRASRVIA